MLLLYGANRAARQRQYDVGLAIDELESDDEQWLSAEWIEDAFQGKELLLEIYSRLLNPTSIALANQVVDDVRAHLGDKVYNTIIPRNVRVSEAPSHGKPAILYDLKCSGSQAYLQLASEVIRQERRLRAA